MGSRAQASDRVPGGAGGVLAGGLGERERRPDGEGDRGDDGGLEALRRPRPRSAEHPLVLQLQLPPGVLGGVSPSGPEVQRRPRSMVVSAGMLAGMSIAAKAGAIEVVPTEQLFCTPKTCPVLVGPWIVYADQHHFARTWGAHIEQAFAAVFDPLTLGRPTLDTPVSGPRSPVELDGGDAATQRRRRRARVRSVEQAVRRRAGRRASARGCVCIIGAPRAAADRALRLPCAGTSGRRTSRGGARARGTRPQAARGARPCTSMLDRRSSNSFTCPVASGGTSSSTRS